MYCYIASALVVHNVLEFAFYQQMETV